MSDTAVSTAASSVAGKLSTLDQFLPVWIGLAMAVGLLLGRLVPGLGTGLSAVEVDSGSLPIAVGLLVMMYPVLAKVRFDQLGDVTDDRKLLVSSGLAARERQHRNASRNTVDLNGSGAPTSSQPGQGVALNSAGRCRPDVTARFPCATYLSLLPQSAAEDSVRSHTVVMVIVT
jgi:hypothetical protein